MEIDVLWGNTLLRNPFFEIEITLLCFHRQSFTHALCEKDLRSAVLWMQFYFFKWEDLGQSCRHFIRQTLTVLSSYSGIIETEKKTQPFHSFNFVSLKQDLETLFCYRTISSL